VALNVQRHSGPAKPRWIAAGRRGWLGSPTVAEQRMLAGTARLPAVVAAHRFDHSPITGK
jgi:hypothetical protein